MDIDVTEYVKLIIKVLKANYGNSLNELIQTFSSRNYEIRLSGETARDIIMNKIPKKMELISSASLYQMRRLFVKKKIPISINEKVATVTMQYHTYKIATAWPAFEKSSQPKCSGTIKAYWMINAYMRVFTVDSTFIDFNGVIYDYFNACEDILNCHVRLMTIDPDSLIKSDYLRILKYFRLFGSVTRSGSGHDGTTLISIKANINGLARLKGELIWSEFKTILLHPKRYECVQTFIECGGGACLGLPENPDLSEFVQIARHSNFGKHPLLGISYMCAFLKTQDDVMRLHGRLRLSAYERDLAKFLVEYKAATRHIDSLMYYRQLCQLPSGRNKQISREYVLELLKYHNKQSLFEHLLLMPSLPCIFDPIVLDRQKGQLRNTKSEATNGISDSSYEHDHSEEAIKESLCDRKKWSASKCVPSSLKKKQRLQ